MVKCCSDANVFFLSGAVVGLERTFYNVSENEGVAEVCAVIYSPMTDCPIEFSFDVRLTTSDGSVGKDRMKITDSYMQLLILIL